ncbi:MAG: carboxylating nicotinate-nucleotide diphosphorylase [Nitrospirae bacterium]|nr:carboxylating nicotinate-nucleotide diphosphorylase [Nitrospirota bacterium]MBF0540242.1 carboxylating nicotinate-nucleotide diphosphorylase [Nitrospirota bacterium]
MDIPIEVREFIKRALSEDIGYGDLTTNLIIDNTLKGEAVLISKERMVIAGVPFFCEVFNQVDPNINVYIIKNDGEISDNGELIVKLFGNTASILRGERVALNILQRLCGVAGMTRALMEKIAGTDALVVDTRKTTPGMRFMEKYAVRVGGGNNHRFGLFDGILIKDNHIKAAGGIANAVKKARHGHHLLKIEVEVTNFNELNEAIAARADVIMLDNMTIDNMKEAVDIIRASDKGILIEASGNVGIENIRDIATTGVDLISAGCITHSVKAGDISLKMV